MNNVFLRIRCELSLNHRWSLSKEVGKSIEQACQKCGKRIVRVFPNLPPHK